MIKVMCTIFIYFIIIWITLTCYLGIFIVIWTCYAVPILYIIRHSYIYCMIWYILGYTMDSASMRYFGVILGCTRNTSSPGVCFGHVVRNSDNDIQALVISYNALYKIIFQSKWFIYYIIYLYYIIYII